MYIQVVEGQVGDATALRARLAGWVTDLSPSAPGWLGTTAGVTTDGTAVLVVRFETAADAAANSIRPEQDAWWRETHALFTGPATFHDCPDAEVYLGGGSDDAGFVQVVRSGIADPHRHNELLAAFEADLADQRPEIIGMTLARHDDGGATQVVYFTDEAAARAGERQGPASAAAENAEEWRSLLVAPRFLDLSSPWLLSPTTVP